MANQVVLRSDLSALLAVASAGGWCDTMDFTAVSERDGQQLAAYGWVESRLDEDCAIPCLQVQLTKSGQDVVDALVKRAQGMLRKAKRHA